MALINVGDHDFKQESPAVWTPDGWGLDRLIVPMRGSVENEEAYIATLEMWSASDIDENMFLSSWVSDNDKQFPIVRLTYLGKKGGTLPPQKREFDGSIDSATSKRGNTNIILAEGATVQYYAPTSVLSYITRTNPGTDRLVDPPGDPEIRFVTFGDASYTIDTIGIRELVNRFFLTQLVSPPIKSTEVVPGQYWQNVARKSKIYTPYIFDLTAGFYPIAFSGGSGYQLNDVISINSGGTCTMRVEGIWTNGAITSTIIQSNSMSRASETPINATGGHGHGAQYTVFGVT